MSFDKVWAAAIPAPFHGCEVRIASIETLIVMKAGVEQGQEKHARDVDYLRGLLLRTGATDQA